MDEDLARYRSEYHAHLYHLGRGGESIAGWTVEQVLGRGGFGAVAKVRRRSGELGALKLAHPTVCAKEAAILRSFGGTTIPTLLADPAELSEVTFPAACYVMELADSTLAHYYAGDQAHPVPGAIWCSLAKDSDYQRAYEWLPYEQREQEALVVAGAILVALGKANPNRHLDLCPSNVLLFGSGPTSWTPKVADWGNARVYEGGGETSYTLIGGKELWCPPRTRAYTLNRPGATPEPPTDKADIYGLGALICWILTATVPDQLARWDARGDPNSGAGLPLDRIDQAWHELLVGATRAARHQRINRDVAMELLVTNRSIVRRRTETTAVPPLKPMPVATADRYPAVPREAPPVTLSTHQGSPIKRWRSFAVAKNIGLVLTIAPLLFFMTRAAGTPAADTPTHSTTKTSPPQQECPQADVWCERELLDHLAAATTAVDQLRAVVLNWHRGPVTHQEWPYNSFVERAFDDVAVLRLHFLNHTETEQQVARDRLGLVVALADGAAVPDGLVRISAPDRHPDTPVLAWVPPIPPHNGSGSTLLPATTVPSNNMTGDGFPYTILFDLSAVGSARIVGLGSGQTPNSATLTRLEAADEWPERKEKLDDVYDDLGDVTDDSEGVIGGCYVSMFEVGMRRRFTDCEKPHDGEIIGTAEVPNIGGGGFDSDNTAETCLEEFAEAGIDLSLRHATAGIPSAGPRGSDNQTVYCVAAPSAESPSSLWVGPQSQAAVTAN